MITVRQKGNFQRLKSYLTVECDAKQKNVLNLEGVAGKAALMSATPVRTGLTRASWHYTIVRTRKGYKLSWYNTNESGGVPVVVLIEYGHGTPSGKYVPARPFVKQAIRPVMARFSSILRQEVKNNG